eukprot:6182640-Pleurochrysis_carterae.AAC.1
MVDAEQTYFQPAIDHAVLHLQRKYNTQFPAVFGTYQACKRTSADAALSAELDRTFMVDGSNCPCCGLPLATGVLAHSMLMSAFLKLLPDMLLP